MQDDSDMINELAMLNMQTSFCGFDYLMSLCDHDHVLLEPQWNYW